MKITKKIRARNITRIVGMLLIVGLIGMAVVTNLLNNRNTALAAPFPINSGDRYFLDGWEMSNTNKLGRVAPVTDLTGKDVTVSGGASVRLDNSNDGFHDNNPLFASIDNNDPFAINPIETDGETHLNSLTVNGGSSVTATPLDFLTSYQGLVSNNYPYGIRYTGYYINSNDIADLEFAAVSDDGAKISVWDDATNNWKEVYNYYTDHSIAIQSDPYACNGYDTDNGCRGVRPINYTHDTYLPIRIDYFNQGYSAAGFGLVMRVSSSPEEWVYPKAGEDNYGRFYTGPNSSIYTEGLVEDYYVDNSLPNKTYNPSDPINKFTNSDFGGMNFARPVWYKTTAFAMQNYRFSFITQSYYKAMNVNTVCGVVPNQAYATASAAKTAYNNCDGTSGPFVKANGTFYNNTDDPHLADELYDVGALERPDDSGIITKAENPNNSASKWYGGRSRIRLDIAGDLNITGGSAIDGKGVGWASGPAVDTNFIHFYNFYIPPFYVTYKNEFVRARGMGYGGGWLNYNNTHNNGVAGGGSFGGVGFVSESTDYNWGALPRNTYGAERDVEYFGSGGGKASNEWSTRSGSGGGMIAIKVNQLQLSSNSKISADGMNGSDTGDGAGSGGGIHILFKTTQNFANENISANGGHNTHNKSVGAGGGGRIWIENATGSSGYITAYRGCTTDYPCDVYNLNVGDWDWSIDNNAKNGTVVIDAPPQHYLSIRKELIPVQRGGVNNSTFNPYALQLGDKIQVSLLVNHLSPGGEIKDDVLKESTGSNSFYYCKPELKPGASDGELSVSSTNHGTKGYYTGGTNPVVTWTLPLTLYWNEDYFTYFCTVVHN